MRKLPAPMAGEFPRRSPARSPGSLAISARPPAWDRRAALGRAVRNLAGPAHAPGPARWIERRSRMRAVSARWHRRELAALHGERGTMEVLKSALERLAPSRPAVAEPAVLSRQRLREALATKPLSLRVPPGWTRREPAPAPRLPRLGLRIAGSRPAAAGPRRRVGPQ